MQYDMTLKAGIMDPEETAVASQRLDKHVPAATKWGTHTEV
jgi:hypothetical protein